MHCCSVCFPTLTVYVTVNSEFQWGHGTGKKQTLAYWFRKRQEISLGKEAILVVLFFKQPETQDWESRGTFTHLVIQRHHWKRVSKETSVEDRGFLPVYFPYGTRHPVRFLALAPTYLRLRLYQVLLSRGMSAPCFYPPSLLLLSHTWRTSVKEPLPRVPTYHLRIAGLILTSLSQIHRFSSVGPMTSSIGLGFYSDSGVSA